MKSDKHLRLPKSDQGAMEDDLRRQAKRQGLKIDIEVMDNRDGTVDLAWTVSDATAPATPPAPAAAKEEQIPKGKGSPAAAPPDLPFAARAGSAATATTLKDADYQGAAEALGSGVSVAIIRAFAEVESGGKSGFGPAGLPVIAYEGHHFRKNTNKKYDKTHPNLSYPYTKKAGPQWKKNNKDQKTAWKTLEDAMALNHDAALQACSWGMFQVMGFNFRTCGYKNVDDFVAAMKAGERGQLEAFVGYCKSTPRLTQALVDKNFALMAKLYNGADYGDYDKKIEKAFKKHGGA